MLCCNCGSVDVVVDERGATVGEGVDVGSTSGVGVGVGDTAGDGCVTFRSLCGAWPDTRVKLV